MKQVNFKNNPSIRKDVEPLYVSAFPVEERPPVKMFFKNAVKETIDLIGFYENDEFIGFTNLVDYQDICYIYFLAVTPEKRNQGYGSKILETVKQLKSDKNLLLCFEEVDEKYKDNSFRIKRRDFYHQNGFKDNIFKSNEFGVVYDSAVYGRQITFDEYLSLLVFNFSDWLKRYIKKAG